MNRLLTIAAVVASFGATQAVEAGHGGCGPTYSPGHGYYGGPSYQSVAPAVPGMAAQTPRDGQTFRSFSYAPEAPAGSIPVAPAYRTYPAYAPSYGMMGRVRGRDLPSFYRADSKMFGRFGR